MLGSSIGPVYAFVCWSFLFRASLPGTLAPPPRTVIPAPRAAPLMLEDDGLAALSQPLSSASALQPASSSSRKRRRSLSPDGAPELGHWAGDGHNSDDEIFFKISHTGLGRHKHFMKGSLSTHDLSIEIVPAIKSDGSIAYLNLALKGEQTKLGTWMSDKQVSPEDLREHWRVWKCSAPLPAGEYVSLPTTSEPFRQVVCEMVRALPHAYFPDMDDLNLMHEMLRAGLVVPSAVSGSFQLLSRVMGEATGDVVGVLGWAVSYS